MGTKTKSGRDERLAARPLAESLTILGHQLAESILISAPHARTGADEGVHQQRVATRRLRSLIRCCSPVLDSAYIDALSKDLAWLGSALGARRDLHVLESHLYLGLDGMSPDNQTAMRECLDEDFARRSAVAEDELREVISSLRYHELMRILGVVELGGYLRVDSHGTSKRVVLPLIHHAWRRLDHSVDRLGTEVDIAGWHRVRMRAKDLRYVVDVFGPIYGSDFDRLGRRLAALTDELGAQRDAYLAAEELSGLAGRVSPQLAFELGRLAAAHDARVMSVRDNFPGLWAEVRKARRTAGI